MTNKKKKQFVEPAVKVVRMQSERSIMAASETSVPISATTEQLTQKTINWGTSLSN